MKRFTETEKWRDPWFRRLPADLKLGYLFMLDSCDNAGVWDPDFDAADFAIGTKVNWIALQAELGERLVLLQNGKWYLTKFISYQYGTLSKACKPHHQVFRIMERHGISPKGRPRQAATQDQSPPPPPVSEITAEAIYEAYPRKVAKQDALRAIEKAMKTTPALALLDATKAYSDAVAQWPEEKRQFIPHPATWFNRGSYADDRRAWVASSSSPSAPEVRIREVLL